MTNQNSKFPRGVEIVGSAIIENSEGLILVTKSPKWNGQWTFPGGHIDPGEKIMDAIARETEEETGLKIDPIEIVVWGELIDSPNFIRPAHLIYFDAYCKLISGEVKLDGRELTEYKWVFPQDALRLDLADAYDGAIKKFIEYKNKL
ncbi:MAG: NUDIX domain-containing protein [Candidatus Daviesbacteria bacterium]|nr:NUDIX domain-containing protein [Candidatus Daviesbacteria bacterium]